MINSGTLFLCRWLIWLAAAMLMPWIAGPAAAIDETSCRAWLADNPSPSSLASLSGAGATQRAALLADGGKLVTIDGRYYAAWFPAGFFTASTPTVVFNLHGTAGYPEAEWNDWHSTMATEGVALIGLSWGGGTSSAASDEDVYALLKQMLAEVETHCPIDSARKWLMGFSVGSAMSFAVMIRDVADQMMFNGQVAVSGAAILPMVSGKDEMHATVESARSNPLAVAGIRAWLYCGELEASQGWRMCDDMLNGESFVNEHGGSATLYRDPTGSHGSLPGNATARTAMFTYLGAADPQPGPFYSVVYKHSEKCQDVRGADSTNGADVIQWPCHDGSNQKLQLVDKGNGYYSLVYKHSGLCTDVFGGGTGAGEKVIQWPCHGGDNQLFSLEDKGGGHYSFRYKHSGQCIDVFGAGMVDAANVIQWPCHGGGNQLFSFVP